MSYCNYKIIRFTYVISYFSVTDCSLLLVATSHLDQVQLLEDQLQNQHK